MAMSTSKYIADHMFRRTIEWVKTSRLNDRDKLEGFDEHIKPFLSAKL